MKLIKIKEDHYVVVSDEPLERWSISNEDPYLSPTGIRYHVDNVPIVNIKDCRKIIYSTTPLGSLGVSLGHKYMPLEQVKELIGEVDVTTKAVRDIEGTSWDEDAKPSFLSGYLRGYRHALEDNKEKKYTEEDMWKAFEYGKTLDGYDWFGDLLESLQPKREWEVEIVDGKLKLK